MLDCMVGELRPNQTQSAAFGRDQLILASIESSGLLVCSQAAKHLFPYLFGIILTQHYPTIKNSNFKHGSNKRSASGRSSKCWISVWTNGGGGHKMPPRPCVQMSSGCDLPLLVDDNRGLYYVTIPYVNVYL